MPTLPETIDIAIVGGSFAGLSAAYPAVRARKNVLMIDNGQPRNAPARASHGVLGFDGAAPDQIRRTGLRELGAYPTFQRIEDTVLDIARDATTGDFQITCRASQPIIARRLILATGQRDILPDIPGLADCWGNSVNQCPYCHGYERADTKTAVLHSGDASLHQASILPDWSADLTYLTNGVTLEPDFTNRLLTLGYQIDTRPIAELIHTDGALTQIKFTDGSAIASQTLYLISKIQPAATLSAMLGCKELEGQFGPYLEVDDLGETTVPGVYAAGDITRPFYNAAMAIADGARAGTFAHQSLATPQKFSASALTSRQPDREPA